MAKLFVSKQKGASGSPSPQVALQNLRETEDMLGKKSEYLESKIQEQEKLARKHGMKNKKAALLALKKKKSLEKRLQQVDGILSTVEFQREALENAHTNTEILKSMNYAAKAIKAAHQNIDINDVHNVLDDIQEQNELTDEISDALSRPTGFDELIDDDDLLTELEALDEESLSFKLTSLNVAQTTLDYEKELPAIPSAIPTKPKVKDNDSELKKLTAWAS